MAAIETTRAHGAPTGILGQTYIRTLGALAAWNDRRNTRNALSKLSDRELDDIGLCRGDIEAVARSV